MTLLPKQIQLTRKRHDFPITKSHLPDRSFLEARSSLFRPSLRCRECSPGKYDERQGNEERQQRHDDDDREKLHHEMCSNVVLLLVEAGELGYTAGISELTFDARDHKRQSTCVCF